MNIIETNLNFNTNHTNRSGDPAGIVLHHAAANGSVEDVHRWHLGNGWAGIGYHFYVRKDGKVYRGRPESWIGSHTSGHNTKLGICAEGNFEQEKMPAAQQKAITELLVYLFNKYGELKVYKHRDLDSTACPGKNYPFDAIVKAASEPEIQKPADYTLGFRYLRKGDRGEDVKALQILLNGYGFNCGATDGIFGSKTEKAVIEAQRRAGKTKDGVVGSDTMGYLMGID